MKKHRIASIVLLVASLLTLSALSVMANPPGRDPSFYRGITTITISQESEIVITENTTVQEKETRQLPNEMYQEREVVEKITTITEVETTVTEAHRGAPNSRGRRLGQDTTVTETVISEEATVEAGDWGPAQNQPNARR